MKNEVLNKEIVGFEYMPEKDLSKIKSKTKEGVLTRMMCFFIKCVVPEVQYNLHGYYKVRYFEFVNTKTGKVRLVKAEEVEDIATLK